jgi:hypothetical protein
VTSSMRGMQCLVCVVEEFRGTQTGETNRQYRFF